MAYCKAFIFQGDYHVDDYIVYKYPGRLFFKTFSKHTLFPALFSISYIGISNFSTILKLPLTHYSLFL